MSSNYDDFVRKLKGQSLSYREDGSTIPTDHISVSPVTEESDFELGENETIRVVSESELPDQLKNKNLGQTMVDAMDAADKAVEDAKSKEETAKKNLDDYLANNSSDSRDTSVVNELNDAYNKAKNERVDAENDRTQKQQQYQHTLEEVQYELIKMQAEDMKKEPESDMKDAKHMYNGAQLTDDSYQKIIDESKQANADNINNLDEQLSEYLASSTNEEFKADDLLDESLLKDIEIFGQNEKAFNTEDINTKHNLTEYHETLSFEVDLGDDIDEGDTLFSEDIADLINELDEAMDEVKQKIADGETELKSVDKKRLNEILDIARRHAYSISDAIQANSYKELASVEAELEDAKEILNAFNEDAQAFIEEDEAKILENIKKRLEKGEHTTAGGVTDYFAEIKNFYKKFEDFTGEFDSDAKKFKTPTKNYYDFLGTNKYPKNTYKSDSVLTNEKYTDTTAEAERKNFVDFFNENIKWKTVYSNSANDKAESRFGRNIGDMMLGLLLLEMESILDILGGPASAVLNKLTQNIMYSAIKADFAKNHKHFYYNGKLDKHTDFFKKSEIFDFSGKGLSFPDGTSKMINFPIFSTNYNVMFQIVYKCGDEAWKKLYGKNGNKVGKHLLNILSATAELTEIQALAKLMSRELNVRLEGITFPSYQQEMKEKHRGSRAIKVPMPHADRETKHSLDFILDEDDDVANFFCGALYNYFKAGHTRPIDLNIIISPHQYEWSDNFYGRVFVFKNVRFYTHKVINNFEKGADAKKAKFDFVCESAYTINKPTTTDIDIDSNISF